MQVKVSPGEQQLSYSERRNDELFKDLLKDCQEAAQETEGQTQVPHHVTVVALRNTGTVSDQNK